MTTHDLTALLNADLSDYENRLVLADALLDAERDAEAALARDLTAPVCVEDDPIRLCEGYTIRENEPWQFVVSGLSGDDEWNVVATVSIDYGNHIENLGDYLVRFSAVRMTAPARLLLRETIRAHVEEWADNVWSDDCELRLQFEGHRAEVIRG